MATAEATRMPFVLRENAQYLCECGKPHYTYPQKKCPAHHYLDDNCDGREGFGCYTQNGGQCPNCSEKYCGRCGGCVSCAAKVLVPPKCEHTSLAEKCPCCRNYYAEYGQYPCGGIEGSVCANCGHCSNCPYSADS